MHLKDLSGRFHFPFFFPQTECRTRNVDAHVGPGDVGPLLACGRTIKFHFCRANVFELAIKQRFSPPSQRTTRPRRGVGPFSFFVYSPTNWFCGIHRPFFSSSSSPSSTPFSPAVSEKPRAISGYANTPGPYARGANEHSW